MQGADGEHHDFDPVSDFTFSELRGLVLAEYAERGSQPSSTASSPSKVCSPTLVPSSGSVLGLSTQLIFACKHNLSCVAGRTHSSATRDAGVPWRILGSLMPLALHVRWPCKSVSTSADVIGAIRTTPCQPHAPDLPVQLLSNACSSPIRQCLHECTLSVCSCADVWRRRAKVQP